MPATRPFLVAAATYLALMGCWQLVATPLLPERLSRCHGFPSAPFWDEVTGAAVFASHGVERADVLFVGDSQAQHGILSAALEQSGLPRAGRIYGAAGQLTVLLPQARRFAARRLVFVISALALHRPGYQKMIAYQRTLYLQHAGIDARERIDRDGNAWLDALRGDTIRTLRPPVWSDGWVERVNPTKAVGFVRRTLRPSSRADRMREFERLQGMLSALLADGWEVVCVRMPVGSVVGRAMNEAFPTADMRAACERLAIPFLDHARAPFPTKDGLHLTYGAAHSYARFLVQELRHVTDWVDEM